MDDLRHEHLGAPVHHEGPTVRATLQAGYEATVARKAAAGNTAV